jgi:hypothetical protein
VTAPLSAPAPLADHHRLDDVSSGETSLDDWLKRRARANQASGASRTFVVCEGEKVVGYYAVASGAVTVERDRHSRYRRPRHLRERPDILSRALFRSLPARADDACRHTVRHPRNAQ